MDIHLQAGFTGQNVSIFFDEVVIFQAERVLSKPSLDYAGHVETQAVAGLHKIRVVVNGETLMDQTLTINSDINLGINLRKGFLGKEKLFIEISHKPFIYD